MQLNAGKLQILTVAAMLVLVSGGIAAYAVNQSASSGGLPAAATPVALAGSDTNSTTTTNSTSTSSTSSTSSTTATTTTTSTTTNHTLCQPPFTVKVGRLVLPITAVGSQASTGALSFSNGMGCQASIATVGGIFTVQISLRYAKPVTQYNVVLVANGTSHTLGNMVTGPGGNGQMNNQVLLTPGTYVVSIQIYDTSSNPGQSTLVLQTGQGTIVSPPFPTASAGQQTPNQGGSQGWPGGQGQQGGPGSQGGQGKNGHR